VRSLARPLLPGRRSGPPAQAGSPALARGRRP
jgi:hypothetical protein